jgi:hypothetical protein
MCFDFKSQIEHQIQAQIQEGPLPAGDNDIVLVLHGKHRQSSKEAHIYHSFITPSELPVGKTTSDSSCLPGPPARTPPPTGVQPGRSDAIKSDLGIPALLSD